MEIQYTKKYLCIYVILSFYDLIYALLKSLCTEFVTVKKVPFQFSVSFFLAAYHY